MTKVQKLTTLFFTGISSIGIAMFFALPRPWTPFGQWLESFFRENDSCTCYWPWYLFILGFVAVGFIIKMTYIHLQLKQTFLWTILAATTIIFIVVHAIAKNYFLQNSTCQDSVYSPWFWLMASIVMILYGLFSQKNK